MAIQYVNKPEIKTSDALHELLRQRREDGYEKDDGIRLHRTISWISAAEYYAEDTDMAFIAYWNAYGAQHEGEMNTKGNRATSNRRESHLHKVARLDTANDLFIILFTGYGEYLQHIIENKYLFRKYYLYKTGEERDWEHAFSLERRAFRDAIVNKDIKSLLSLSLYRLSVLRNQMSHGAATYQGSVNRETLDMANAFLSEVIPKMTEIMLRGEDWGEITFDVLDQPIVDKG